MSNTPEELWPDAYDGSTAESVAEPLPFPCEIEVTRHGRRLARIAGIPGDEPCVEQLNRSQLGWPYADTPCKTLGYCMVGAIMPREQDIFPGQDPPQ